MQAPDSFQLWISTKACLQIHAFGRGTEVVVVWVKLILLPQALPCSFSWWMGPVQRSLARTLSGTVQRLQNLGTFRFVGCEGPGFQHLHGTTGARTPAQAVWKLKCVPEAAIPEVGRKALRCNYAISYSPL